MSFRCQCNKVSGVTIVATSARICPGGEPAALIIVEPQPAFAELLPQDTILFAQVLDRMKLALIHPAGNSGVAHMVLQKPA
jgi:hypothetical protein